MAELRHGGDGLYHGVDRLLHGGVAEPHDHAQDAAMVYETATLVFPSGERWNLWTGPGSVLVPGTVEELRKGLTHWYWDGENSPEVTLPQATADTRITAVAQDPLIAGRYIVVSSTDVCFWLVNPLAGNTIRTAIDDRPSWLPADHSIYPIGGAAFLRDGTLVIACWAGKRVDDPSAIDGVRHIEGRWCFYLNRIRNPLPDPDRLDEDGNRITFPKAAGAPDRVDDSLVTRPFPTGDRGLRYDFSKFHALVGYEMRNALFSENSIKFFGYSNDLAEGLDDDTGVFRSGFYQFTLKAAAFTDTASVADDYLPQRIEDADGNSLVLRVTGAPSWATRGLYRSVADNGVIAYWLRDTGDVIRTNSLSTTTQFTSILLAITSDPEFGIPLTTLRLHFPESYRCLLIRSAGDLWFFRRLLVSGEPTYDRIVPGIRYTSAAQRLVSVSPSVKNEGVDDTVRMRITLSLPRETLDYRLVQDPGRVFVKVDDIISIDSGMNWQHAGRATFGRLGAASFTRGIGGGYRPAYDAGITLGTRSSGVSTFSSGAGSGYFWSAELHTDDSDVFRGAPRYFSNSDQQERFSGDRIFEGGEDLEESLRRWGTATTAAASP